MRDDTVAGLIGTAMALTTGTSGRVAAASLAGAGAWLASGVARRRKSARRLGGVESRWRGDPIAAVPLGVVAVSAGAVGAVALDALDALAAPGGGAAATCGNGGGAGSGVADDAIVAGSGSAVACVDAALVEAVLAAAFAVAWVIARSNRPVRQARKPSPGRRAPQPVPSRQAWPAAKRRPDSLDASVEPKSSAGLASACGVIPALPDGLEPGAAATADAAASAPAA